MLGGSFVAALLISVVTVTALSAASRGAVSGGSIWFPAVIQLLGMGYLSPANAEVQSSFLSYGSSGSPLSGSFFAWPALVPVLGLVAVAVFGRRVASNVKAPTLAPRLVLSAAAGLASAVVVTVLAATIPLTVVAGGNGAIFRAASFLGFLGVTVAVGATVFVALLPASSSPRRLLTRATVTTTLEHVLALGAVIAIGIVIASAINDPKNLLLIPLLLPIAVLDGFGLLHLVPAELSQTGNSSHDYYGLFADTGSAPGWVVPVAVLVTVLCLLVVSLRWRARRGIPGRKASGWLVLPTSYAILGAAITVGSIVTFRLDGLGTGPSEYSMTFSLAAWGFLVIAILGLVIEALSRFVMVPLAAILPAGLYKVLTWNIAAQPVAPEEVSFAGSVPQGIPAQESTTQGTPASQLAEGDAASQINPTASGMTAPGASEAQTKANQHAVGAPLASASSAMTPATKRRWMLSSIVAGVVIVLVIAGSITVNALGNGTYGPQKKVEAYLQALVDGKASEAAKILNPNVTDDKRVFLTDDVYSKAENRPSSFIVGETEVDDKTATVSARVTQNGKEFPLTFNLEKEGKQAVIFDDWRVSDGPGFTEVEYARGAETLTVNGAEVKAVASFPLDAPDGTDAGAPLEPFKYPVYPGTYTFSAPKASKYLTYGEDIKVTVHPDGTFDQPSDGGNMDTLAVGFKQSYTQAVIDDATSQVNERIKSCVGTTERVPAKCKTASWEYSYGKETQILSRAWSVTPDPVVMNNDSEYGYSLSQQEELSTLSGQLVVGVPNAEISVNYRYKSSYSSDNKWEDASFPETYDPFSLASSGFTAKKLLFPIKIEGDVLTVDTSALDTENTKNLKTD